MSAIDLESAPPPLKISKSDNASAFSPTEGQQAHRVTRVDQIPDVRLG